MNEIIKKFILTGDKFVPEFHLKQPGPAHITCRLFTKYRERETGNFQHLYRNKLDKLCLFMTQHVLIVKIQIRELIQIRF